MTRQTHYRNDWNLDQIARDAAERSSGRASETWSASCFFESRPCLGRVLSMGDFFACECPCHDEERAVHQAPPATHACPPYPSDGLMPCCMRTPFEVSRADLITLDPALVTCKGVK